MGSRNFKIITVVFLIAILLGAVVERRRFFLEFSSIVENDYGLSTSGISFLWSAGDRTNEPRMTIYNPRKQTICVAKSLSQRGLVGWSGGSSFTFTQQQATLINEIIRSIPEDKIVVAASVSSLSHPRTHLDKGVIYEKVYKYMEENGWVEFVGYDDMGRKVYQRTFKGAIYSGVFSCP